MLRRTASFLIVTIALATAAVAQRGALTQNRSLTELVAPAEVVVRGHVVSAFAEPHPRYPNLDTIVVTVSAESVLKGKTGRTYTFRQFIWDPRDRMDAAGYRKGHEVLLIMNKVNANGLTSPVGLTQGRFRIITDQQGKKLAVNGENNGGLFAALKRDSKTRTRLSMSTARTVSGHEAGPVPIEQLEEVIRQLAGGQQ